jgi:hypothetical protein
MWSAPHSVQNVVARSTFSELFQVLPSGLRNQLSLARPEAPRAKDGLENIESSYRSHPVDAHTASIAAWHRHEKIMHSVFGSDT